MPEQKNKFEKALEEVGTAFREGMQDAYAVTEAELASVRETIRSDWEKSDQHAQKAENAEGVAKEQSQSLEQQEEEKRRKEQDQDDEQRHGHGH